jgi:hypothetical protein
VRPTRFYSFQLLYVGLPILIMQFLNYVVLNF